MEKGALERVAESPKMSMGSLRCQRTVDFGQIRLSSPPFHPKSLKSEPKRLT